MIYRCKDEECRFIADQEEPVLACPLCGEATEIKAEDALAGREWTLLGVWWTEQQDQGAEALRCFRRAAELADPWGICNLGWCLESGVGTDPDPRQACW